MCDNHSPTPTDIVKTVRSMCNHKVYDMEVPEFEATVASSVIATHDLIMKGHMTGVVYNEETKFPYAVISDYEGGTLVVWDFEMNATDFSSGLLSFSKWLDTKDWAAAAAMGMIRAELSKGTTPVLYVVEKYDESL